MNEIRIAIVQAGLSMPSTTSTLADVYQRSLASAVDARGVTPRIDRINLRDYAVAIAEATVSGVKAEALETALAAVEQAHIVVAITPTFNASFSGLFKSFFDVVQPKALDGTVVALGATGGTARHSLVVDLAMRPLFAYMRASTVPTSIFASADDFAGSSSIAQRVQDITEEALALVEVPAHEVDDPSTPGTTPPPTLTRSERAAVRRDVGVGESEVLESDAGGFVDFSTIASALNKRSPHRRG